MAPLEYLGEALESWPQYVLLVGFFLALHWVLAKRWTVGIYDPMFLLLMTNAFGWSIVWFMYLRGDIATVYVVSFTAAQVAFYVGIAAGQPSSRRPPVLQPAPERNAVAGLTLAMAAAAHVASTLAIWGIAGIPLFRASRLGAFEASGGLGILERVAESSALIAIFSVTYLLVHFRHQRRSVPVLVFLAWYGTSLALSGSKGALMSVGQFVLSVLFVYTSLRRRHDSFWGGRAGALLLLAASGFAIIVLATQYEGDLGTAALAFAYRVVSYGDVYIFAYPDATMESLRGDNPLVGLFGGFLSTFRLFPQELVYPNLGYQFTGLLFPDLDLIVGPNPQHPIFGRHYFGSLGFLFSFAVGLVTARAQVRFFDRVHGTFLSGLVAFILYFTLVSIGVDFEYTLSKLASAIIGLVIVVLPVLLLQPRAAIVRLGPPSHGRSP